MDVDKDAEVEAQIGEWRAYMRRHRELSAADTEELEDHLRNRIVELTDAGLRPDEAFLVSVKRMGSLDALTREFAREHSERLWKQLVLTGDAREPDRSAARRDFLVMLGCAVVAAIAVKIPTLFGLELDDDAAFYARNLSLFGLVPLAAYFVWRRAAGPRVVGVLAALFAVGAVAANAYPFADEAATSVLTAIHLPIALWLTFGIAYVGGDWRSTSRRMDFVRFTGEWFIYYVLIALGGGVLTALTVGAFNAIGLDIETFIGRWLLPCGAMAAIVVAAWLVEAKQSVIENMAPVLSRVFTPLFVLTLLAFAGGAIGTRTWVGDDRNVLILFDLLLAVVLGLLLYAISAREPAARPGWFDRLQFVLVVVAMLIDLLMLAGVIGRITEFGFSANRTAALGENIVLLANLAWSAWLLLGFLRNRAPIALLDRWQTRYLTVYAAWAWALVLTFPLIFGWS